MSLKKVLIVGMVALLVLGAGCSSFSGGELTTDAPGEPTAATTIQNGDGGEEFAFPDGASEDGADGERLFRGSMEAYQSNIYELSGTLDSHSNSERSNVLEYNVKKGDNAVLGQQELIDSDNGETFHTIGWYATDGDYRAVDEMIDRGDGQTVSETEQLPAETLMGSYVFNPILSNSELTFQETTSMGGEQVAVYTFDTDGGEDMNRAVRSAHGINDDSVEITSIDGSVAVTQSGLIKSAEYEVGLSNDATLAHNFDVQNDGDVSVEEPSWLGDSVSAKIDVIDRTDSYVQVEISASQSIEGANLAYYIAEEDNTLSNSVGTTLEDGDVIYITTQDGDVKVTTDEPSSGTIHNGKLVISLLSSEYSQLDTVEIGDNS